MGAVVHDLFKRSFPYYLGKDGALQQLKELDRYIGEKKRTFIGYPCNGHFSLEPFFHWWEESNLSKTPLNDVGNPYTTTSYTLNTHHYETIVVDYFADLFSVHPHWGYVTSAGTQGNEQGLYIGRTVLSKYGRPILYFSEEAHYSIASLAKVLGLDSCIIRSQLNGEMDYEDLQRQLDIHRPALFSLSIGTTFKGGIDRIDIVDAIVKKKGVKNVFYHADGALFGGYLPFYSNPAKVQLDFQLYPYDSIAVSGHKFFGSPTPMGMFLVRNRHIDALDADYIEYVHTKNITIPCSRSSLHTLIFWWIITTTSQAEFTQQADAMIHNADYFYKQLQERHYPSWLNDHSNTVYFKAPSASLSRRWTLASFTCPKLGPLAHAVIMQHVTLDVLDEFLHDLDEEIAEHHVEKNEAI